MMNGSKTLQSWLQMGTIRKRSADQEENISSSPVETEVDDSEPSTSASGYFSSASEVSTAPASSKRRKTVRKYDSSYVKFGFSWSGMEEEPRPQCVVCGDVLTTECMKPSHLKRHLTTKHAMLKDKPVDFFLRKRDKLKQSKSTIQSCVSPVAKAQEASYRASLRIAKAGKPHTIGEQLCPPLAKEMTCIVCGEKAAKQLNLVSLSNDTVPLIKRIKSSGYYSI